MLGMVGNNVQSVKPIGRRDIDMDAQMKSIFLEGKSVAIFDFYYFYPHFNDAKELFRI